MPTPSVVSITRLVSELPRDMSGAAVVPGDTPDTHYLVGPGILEVKAAPDGSFTTRDIVTADQLPVRLPAARRKGRTITVYSGHHVSDQTLCLPNAATFSLDETNRLIASDVAYLPEGRKGMACAAAGIEALLISGQDSSGKQDSIGFDCFDQGTQELVDDAVIEIPLTEGMPVGAPLSPGCRIVVIKPEGEKRRVLVLGTGYPEITEIVRVKKAPRIKLSGIHMPYATRDGGACSLFGGLGFAYVGGTNANNDPIGRIVLGHGTGSPSVSAQELPTAILKPCVFPVSDTSFIVASGQTGWGGVGGWTTVCYLVSCAV